LGRGAWVLVVAVVWVVVVGPAAWVVVVDGPPAGAGVVVVPVCAGVVAVVVVPVCVGACGAGVVEVSDGELRPVDGSAASTPPVSGPARPAAVKPPPASTERTARRAVTRAPLNSDMPARCSSRSRPMVVFKHGSSTP
jgi:hypothetical protein